MSADGVGGVKSEIMLDSVVEKLVFFVGFTVVHDVSFRLYDLIVVCEA